MSRESVAAEKAYAYVTRSGGDPGLLVFEHRNADAGVQVPKGTVDEGEDPRDAVVRELYEESGLREVAAVRPLATDVWSHHRKPKAYRRHFFHVEVEDAPDEWDHTVTGGGEDDGLVYCYFWADPAGISLARDMDDYLDLLY